MQNVCCMELNGFFGFAFRGTNKSKKEGKMKNKK